MAGYMPDHMQSSQQPYKASYSHLQFIDRAARPGEIMHLLQGVGPGQEHLVPRVPNDGIICLLQPIPIQVLLLKREGTSLVAQ